MSKETNELLVQLQQVVDSNQGDTFLIHDGIAITDPSVDETGRFEVNPIEHYSMEAIISVLAEYRGEFLLMTTDVVIQPLRYRLFETETFESPADERIRLLSICSGAGMGTAMFVDSQIPRLRP